jgi:lipoate-protein ligase A
MQASVDALVLGSTQSAALVDVARAENEGIDVVRRATGGGAVLVSVDEVLWVDLVVPAGDRLWDHDVVRSFDWLGESWVAALARFGIDAESHRGRPRPSRWGDLVCFAGLGSGEVRVDGRKVVGLSQRRTREGARLQAIVYRRFDPAGLPRLLNLDPGERADLTAVLAASAGAVTVDAEDLCAALLECLPA